MSKTFWIGRFLVVLCGAFVLITGVEYLKGFSLEETLIHGLIWAPITATVFTAVRIYQSRRGQHCPLCKDTPEMQNRT